MKAGAAIKALETHAAVQARHDGRAGHLIGKLHSASCGGGRKSLGGGRGHGGLGLWSDHLDKNIYIYLLAAVALVFCADGGPKGSMSIRRDMKLGRTKIEIEGGS